LRTTHNLAAVYDQLGRFGDAVHLLENAPPRWRGVAQIRLWLALSYALAGRNEPAAAEYAAWLDLFSETVIAIDGSRFKAVNTRDKNYTHGAIERRMEQVEASIARYLSALDTADRQEEEMEIAVQAASDRQISLTDPDARAMATSGKGNRHRRACFEILNATNLSQLAPPAGKVPLTIQ
jgi:tetratricopeptide (TPR) repeat protein